MKYIKFTALDPFHMHTSQRIQAFQEADCEAVIVSLRKIWMQRETNRRFAREAARLFGCEE